MASEHDECERRASQLKHVQNCKDCVEYVATALRDVARECAEIAETFHPYARDGAAAIRKRFGLEQHDVNAPTRGKELER